MLAHFGSISGKKRIIDEVHPAKIPLGGELLENDQLQSSS